MMIPTTTTTITTTTKDIHSETDSERDEASDGAQPCLVVEPEQSLHRHPGTQGLAVQKEEEEEDEEAIIVIKIKIFLHYISLHR